MSLIPCTQDCKFQQDGLCMLEQTSNTGGQASPNDLCLNFTPRSNQYGNRLTDVADANQA